MSSEINKLMLIRGLPGSGKSHFASFNSDRIHLEADMFFMNDGNYEFDPSRIKEAHEWCQKSAKIFLNNGKNVVISNTFTRIWEMQPYFDMVRDLNIKCCVYRMMTQYNNIHNVPPEMIERMRVRFEDYPGEILVK